MKNKMEKVKVCCMISDSLFNRMQSDFINFGVAKSYIINSALMEYYERRPEDKATAVKGA